MLYEGEIIVTESPETVAELYNDIDWHLIEDAKPSDYLKGLYDEPLFREFPFTLLYPLKSTEQSPEHHPEGNVWNHTMLVVDEAAELKNKSRNQQVLMWAAFLHDIGKPPTTKIRRGKITSYDHDIVGAALSKEFLQVFISDEKIINEVCQLIKYHMQILYVVKDMQYADIKGMKLDTDIKELALLGFCNRVGREGYDRNEEVENIKLFLHKCL